MVAIGGSVVPPLPYLIVLVVAAGAAAGLLVWRRPAVTERVLLALAPWMLVGAGLRTLPQIDAVPPVIAPLFGTTAVYATTFAVVAGVWAAVDYALEPSTARKVLAGSGLLVVVVVVGVAVANRRGGRPLWSLAGLVGSLVLTGLTWLVLQRVDARTGEAMPLAGPLVVFSHAVDGVSTAVGIDVLGFGEKTPTSAFILELAGQLPTASLLGKGWLFVAIKLFAASVIVALFVDYVREEPTWGFLLLGAAAAVGLGPGFHNLLLYAVAG